MWTLLSGTKTRRWQGLTLSDRTWLLTRIAVGSLTTYLVLAVLLVAHSPALASRAAMSAAGLVALVATTFWLAKRERPTLGAVTLLSGLLTLVTLNARVAGGIESPGIQAYFLFVVLGGLLLGWRGALGYAMAIVAISGWLAMEHQAGSLPTAVVAYDAVDRWVFVVLYTVVALLVVLAAERSQRRLFEAVQVESEARAHALRQLETALEVGGYGRFVHDVRTQRYRPDAAVVALTGLAPGTDGTVDIAAWGDRLHPEDRARVDAMLAPIFRGEAEHQRVSYRFLHPVHGLKYIDASLLLQRNSDGEPLGVTGLLLDLTTQQETIHRLGERLKEMRLLYHAAHVLRDEQLDATATLNTLLQHVPSAWQFPELAEARLSLGALELKTIGWTGRGPRLDAPLSSAAGGGVLSVEYRDEPVAAAGQTFLVEEAELLEAVASLISSWWVATGERERFRQIEARMQQAQRLEAVGTFASGIAHDFNNVLTAVIATADAARASATTAPETLPEDLDQIIAAGRRGQDLVQRIRRLGQREELVRQPVSLCDLITEVVALARASAPPTVHLEVICAADVPHAWADPSQLHQVLLNLLSNAFHATKDTTGRVTVRLFSVPALAGSGRTGVDCIVTVSDTGVGMPTHVAARIFEPFFTTKGEAGTGLGLSMVHGIMRDHDGVVQVVSAPGEGTTFELRLPAARAGAGALSEPTQAAAPDEDRARSARRETVVLLVDDDVAVLQANRRVLERAGYPCIASANPRDAIERFVGAPNDVSIVVSDMHMPDVTGLDLIRQLRSVRSDMPAILCSGVDPLGASVMLEQEGIHWVAKPPRSGDLVRAVELAIRRAARGGA